LDYYGI